MTKVESADRCRRPHGIAFRQADADGFLDLQELPERALLRVIGTGRITWRRPDASVFLGDQIFFRELLVLAVAPVAPSVFVQQLGKGLCQAVGQGLGHDGVVVVVSCLELPD